YDRLRAAQPALPGRELRRLADHPGHRLSLRYGHGAPGRLRRVRRPLGRRRGDDPEQWGGSAFRLAMPVEGCSSARSELLDRIVVDPEIMVGKPVIRGTHIPVELILE